MSQPLPPGVSPYTPRGRVAHELHALRLTIIFTDIYLTLVIGFGAFFMVKAFNRVDTAATTATKIQTVQQGLVTATAAIQDLQQQQVTSSVTGRAILAIVAQQTSPTATAHQQEAVAGYLKSLTDAQKVLNADLLRKVGEFAQCVPCSPQQVQRILAEPVPVITFGPPPTAPMPAPTSTPTAKATIAPRPSPAPTLSPTPFLQVQCPILCPRPTPTK